MIDPARVCNKCMFLLLLIFFAADLFLQSNQVKGTLQDYINELIKRILNPLVIPRIQLMVLC